MRCTYYEAQEGIWQILRDREGKINWVTQEQIDADMSDGTLDGWATKPKNPTPPNVNTSEEGGEDEDDDGSHDEGDNLV
jgi:hypothetical protein